MFVGWSGSPYGAHATVGVGYKIVDSQRFLILHDTWHNAPYYVNYEEYNTSISGYTHWFPPSKENNNHFIVQSSENDLTCFNSITIIPEKVEFDPLLRPEDYAYHCFENADINGDSKEDLVVCNFRNHCSENNLLVYYFQNGKYLKANSFNPDFQWFECLHIAKSCDFDNDGDVDIAATGYWSYVRIYINDGTSLNPEPIVVDVGARGFIDLDWSDFDNDADFDILSTTVKGEIIIYENQNGSFNMKHVFDLGSQSFKALFHDIDNDSSPDLIAAKRNGTVVIFKNSNGSFSETPDFSPSSGHGCMAFDAMYSFKIKILISIWL